jgi:hypothetical protein
MGRPSRAPVSEAMAMESEQVVKVLQFTQQTLSRTGKPIEEENLVAYRKTLQREVQDLDQECVDRSSLATPAKILASVKLLQHLDEGIVAYTACYLTDMLRLPEPEEREMRPNYLERRLFWRNHLLLGG